MTSKTSIDYADSLICHMIPDWKNKYAYRLLKLRCLCGLPPRIAKSINTKPGEKYYYCGDLSMDNKERCQFFLWDTSIHHFHETLCFCGQPTYHVHCQKTNRDSYVCIRKLKYTAGCNYCSSLE